MKSDKQSDKLLREKLNSYSSPVPAGLFDAMDKKRTEQKKPKALAWYAKAGIASVALLFVATICYWNTGTKMEDAVVKPAVKQTEQIEQVEQIAKNTNTLVDNSKSTATKVKENESMNSSSPISQEETLVNTAKQVKNTKSLSETIVSTPIQRQTDRKVNLVKTESTTPSITIENTKTLTAESIVVEKESELSEISESTTAKLTAERASTYQITSLLQRKDFMSQNQYHASMPRIKCGWEARKVYLYLDALTSIDMAFRRLTPKDTDSSPYAILRNNTEAMQESFSLGFRASAVTRGGFAMRSGLIYSQIKEPFSQRIFTEELTIIETRDEEENIISIDTIVNTVVEKFQTTNRHKLLDVPLILGYEIDKDKYNISVNGGAYVNITATQEGNILTPNEEIVNISTTSPNRYDAFKTNVGLSLYGSFAINYKITPAIHFIFEPYGRYFMDSFTTDTHELKQNYFVTGMQVGMRLKM